MARLQNSLPLSVLIALGTPLVPASCSRTRTSWFPPSARSGPMATALLAERLEDLDPADVVAALPAAAQAFAIDRYGVVPAGDGT